MIYFAVAATWGFAFVLFERAHVRIVVVYQSFSTALRAWFDLIAPLIGVNLFGVQGIRRQEAPFRDVCMGSIPFVITMLLMVFLLMAVSEIATSLLDLICAK